MLTDSYMKFSSSIPRRPSRTPIWWRRTGDAIGRRWRMTLGHRRLLRRRPLFRRLRGVRQGGAEDILVRITAINRGPEAAELHLLPTLWFRNDWAAWIARPAEEKPNLKQIKGPAGTSAVARSAPARGGGHRPSTARARCRCSLPTTVATSGCSPEHPNPQPIRQGRHRQLRVALGEQGAVNPEQTGTKVAAHDRLQASAPAKQRRCGCASPPRPRPVPARKP